MNDDDQDRLQERARDRKQALFDLVDWIAERIVRDYLEEEKARRAQGIQAQTALPDARITPAADEIAAKAAIEATQEPRSPARSKPRTQARTRLKNATRPEQ